MGRKFDYDLIVIGSGPAGTSAALVAAKAGQKVAIIEAGKWGGSSLNSTDIPAQAAFQFSHLLQEAKRGSRFGISSSSLRYNYPTVQNWKHLATRRAGAGSKKIFESAKIACFSGFASFLSPYEVAVKDLILSAPKFVVATGAKLEYGDISGVESATCYTPSDALSLPRPPKSVFIVGAGPTGVELANYFAELGTQVMIGELEGGILPHEDREVGRILTQYFETTFRMKILTNTRIVAVQKSNKPGMQRIIFRRGGQEKYAESTAIVLATGSKPVTNLSLENAGVNYDEDGIYVDDYLRTNSKHIYAAGDCIGEDSSVERASYEGMLAATNLIGRHRLARNYDGFVRITNTNPSVATAGLTENECSLKRIKIKKSVVPLSSVSSANTTDFRFGFVKILIDSKSRIIGATIVCPHAELMIGELNLAIKNKLLISQLANLSHVSASWSELIHISAHNLAK